MEARIFYRVGNNETRQGLWYDQDGNFTGLIHDKYSFCKNSNLPMPYDEEVVGWLSATDELENLFHWFPIEDIIKLEKYGYKVFEYTATEYRMYQNHWVIKQDNSVINKTISTHKLKNI